MAQDHRSGMKKSHVHGEPPASRRGKVINERYGVEVVAPAESDEQDSACLNKWTSHRHLGWMKDLRPHVFGHSEN